MVFVLYFNCLQRLNLLEIQRMINYSFVLTLFFLFYSIMFFSFLIFFFFYSFNQGHTYAPKHKSRILLFSRICFCDLFVVVTTFMTHVCKILDIKIQQNLFYQELRIKYETKQLIRSFQKNIMQCILYYVYREIYILIQLLQTFKLWHFFNFKSCFYFFICLIFFLFLPCQLIQSYSLTSWDCFCIRIFKFQKFLLIT